MAAASHLPTPLVSAEVDLKDFPYTPIFRARLFGSAFNALANDAAWRAGVILWLKSWDQVPAGSLPMDAGALCRLAELGRDLKAWGKVAGDALHGWFEASDGRLYHRVVAQGVNQAWLAKQRQRWATECARLRKECERSKVPYMRQSFDDWRKSQGQPPPVTVTTGDVTVTTGDVTVTSADVPVTEGPCHKENASKRERKREVREEGGIPPIIPPLPDDDGAGDGPSRVGSRRKREAGSRLSHDWQPGADDWQFAQDLGLDPEWMAAEFRDYWCSLPDQPAARKLDWSATFRNRCREIASRGRGGNGWGRRGADRPGAGGVAAALSRVRLAAADEGFH